MAILEAPYAQNAPGRSTMRPPEALPPRNPTWGSPHFSGLTTFWVQMSTTYSKGPKIKKLKLLLRDWDFQTRMHIQASPPTKASFLWGILKVKIEMFKRDWSFQAGLENVKRDGFSKT